MRTLHYYLLRQVLAAFVMSVAIFTFVLFLDEVIKEILTKLVAHAITPGQVVQAFALLLPYVMCFSLPMSILAATMLVLGRFSADQELTAVRAGGISLLALVTPVLILSVLLSGLCGWFNLELGPRYRVKYRAFLLEIGLAQPNALLTEGMFIYDFPNHILYIGSLQGDRLKEVQVYQLNSAGQMTSHFHAPSGKFELDATNKTVNLHLFGQRGAVLNDGKWVPLMGDGDYLLDFKPQVKPRRDPKISDMTFRELRDKLAEVERLGLDPTLVVVHMHRQLSTSFACFSFALIGIPLSIRAHRRETSIGIVFALGLSALYYSFVIFGQSLSAHGEYYPYLILWLPNFIFQIAGVLLLRRVNRGI